jgi:hypothetical protein
MSKTSGTKRGAPEAGTTPEAPFPTYATIAALCAAFEKLNHDMKTDYARDVELIKYDFATNDYAHGYVGGKGSVVDDESGDWNAVNFAEDMTVGEELTVRQVLEILHPLVQLRPYAAALHGGSVIAPEEPYVTFIHLKTTLAQTSLNPSIVTKHPDWFLNTSAGVPIADAAEVSFSQN